MYMYMFQASGDFDRCLLMMFCLVMTDVILTRVDLY